MRFGKKTPTLCILLTFVLGYQRAEAQSKGKRVALSTEEIALALTNAGFPVTAAEVQLPFPVIASAPAPKLRMEKQEQTGPHQRRLRLACVDAGACIPFYATITGATDAPSSPMGLDSSGAAGAALQPVRASTTVLHAGEQALFYLENRFMRISLPVVLIDTGHTGNAVRVASLDRKQVYQGKVWDDGTIHGSLP